MRQQEMHGQEDGKVQTAGQYQRQKEEVQRSGAECFRQEVRQQGRLRVHREVWHLRHRLLVEQDRGDTRVQVQA